MVDPMVGADPKTVKDNCYRYHYRCLSCEHEERFLPDLETAEQTARQHANTFDHKVRLSMDLLGVEIRTFTGGRE